MPELPELEALRLQLGPRLEGRLVTAVEVNPKKGHLLRYPVESFRRRLRRYRDELKDLLRNQAFCAGVGNAYSDEILFEARLLPLRRRASLKPDEEAALFEAIPTVLRGAVEAILANPDYQESK